MSGEPGDSAPRRSFLRRPAWLRPATLQARAEKLLSRDLLWSIVFVVLLAPVLDYRGCGLPLPQYRAGDIAPTTLKAPYDVEVLDEAATRRLRQEERDRVLPVYDFLPAPADELKERARAALSSRTLPAETQEAALRACAAIAANRIVSRREGLMRYDSIIIREVGAGPLREAPFAHLDQILDLDEARGALRARIDGDLEARAGGERRAVAGLLEGVLAPNLSLNASETERRRAAAMGSVPDVLKRIARGRAIVREGEVITPEAEAILAQIRGHRAALVSWKGLAGAALVLALLTIFLHRYIRAHQRLFRRVKNLYTMVLLTSLATTLLCRAGLFVINAVADQFHIFPFSEPEAWFWALPVSAGALLVTLLANGRVATVGGAITAVLFGAALGWNAQAILFALISSFAAIYGFSQYEQRTAILKAGFWIGAINAVVAFALSCISTGFEAWSQGFLSMAAGFCGGLGAAVLVSFSLPVMEWLFDVLTDVRLLELSNLENPLLRRLALEAPGTYNHSVVVGTLSEQAAEDIGAHALLCRVAAYYHDIGKLAQPEYFVENVSEGPSRHDRIAPRMSSLVIANHVKEGMRLAAEHGLPRQVADMIPQHHGTRLITYFYRKARRNEDPETPEIHEHDYRYPGPRPQTREAAIFMMADSIEAAARSVDEPTPGRFEEVVDQISNAIVLDNQLDECDLTFSDLAKIRAAFVRTLLAVHHHRVAYPGYDFDRSRVRAVEAE